MTAGKRTPTVKEDPVEAGRAGGLASGRARSRERAYVNQLRERVLNGKGIQSYAAMRAWLEDLEGREQRCRAREIARDEVAQEVAELRAQTAYATETLRRIWAETEKEEHRLVALREKASRLETQLEGDIDELERARNELRAEVIAEGVKLGRDLVEVDDDEPEGGTGGGSVDRHPYEVSTAEQPQTSRPRNQTRNREGAE